MAETIAEPFNSKQLILYKPRATDVFDGDPVLEITGIAELSSAVTLLEADTGYVVAVGGVLPLWKGVGDVWMVGSDLVPKYPRAIYRLARAMLREASKGLTLRRLQCTVDPRYEEHVRFIERLGFTSEGLMRKFGPHGEDHVRYAKVI
jgi:RimJ/RimL family protein N-acetyltransferase